MGLSVSIKKQKTKLKALLDSVSTQVRKSKYTEYEYEELEMTQAKLNRLLSNSIGDADFLSLAKKLLKKRWHRIKDTNLAYPHAGDHPVSKACILLATYLGKKSKKSDHYAFLMPTLTCFDTVSFESIHKYEPHEFVMSDDNRAVIILADCLSTAAGANSTLNQDKTLKFRHTSLRNGNEKVLSDTERARVINANPITFKYVEEARGELLKLKATLYLELKLLIDGLKQGSIKGDGSEGRAAVSAYNAVMRFNKVTQYLNSYEKVMLFSLHKKGGLTFESYWTNLLSSLSSLEKRRGAQRNNALCADIVQTRLGEIIEEEANKEKLVNITCLDKGSKSTSSISTATGSTLNAQQQPFKDELLKSQKEYRANPYPKSDFLLELRVRAESKTPFKDVLTKKEVKRLTRRYLDNYSDKPKPKLLYVCEILVIASLCQLNLSADTRNKQPSMLLRLFNTAIDLMTPTQCVEAIRTFTSKQRANKPIFFYVNGWPHGSKFSKEQLAMYVGTMTAVIKKASLSEKMDAFLATLCMPVEADKELNTISWLTAALSNAIFYKLPLPQIHTVSNLLLTFIEKVSSSEKMNAVLAGLCAPAKTEAHQGKNTFFWLGETLACAATEIGLSSPIQIASNLLLTFIKKASSSGKRDILLAGLRAAPAGAGEGINTFYLLLEALANAIQNGLPLPRIQAVSNLLLTLIEASSPEKMDDLLADLRTSARAGQGKQTLFWLGAALYHAPTSRLSESQIQTISNFLSTPIEKASSPGKMDILSTDLPTPVDAGEEKAKHTFFWLGAALAHAAFYEQFPLPQIQAISNRLSSLIEEASSPAQMDVLWAGLCTSPETGVHQGKNTFFWLGEALVNATSKKLPLPQIQAILHPLLTLIKKVSSLGQMDRLLAGLGAQAGEKEQVKNTFFLLGEALVMATIRGLSALQIEALSSLLSTLIEKASSLKKMDGLLAGLSGSFETGKHQGKNTLYCLGITLANVTLNRSSRFQTQIAVDPLSALIKKTSSLGEIDILLAGLCELPKVGVNQGRGALFWLGKALYHASRQTRVPITALQIRTMQAQIKVISNLLSSLIEKLSSLGKVDVLLAGLCASPDAGEFQGRNTLFWLGQALANAIGSQLFEPQIQAVSNPLSILIKKASSSGKMDVLLTGLCISPKKGVHQGKNTFFWLGKALCYTSMRMRELSCVSNLLSSLIEKASSPTQLDILLAGLRAPAGVQAGVEEQGKNTFFLIGAGVCNASSFALSKTQIRVVSNPLLTLIKKASSLKKMDVLLAGLCAPLETGIYQGRNTLFWLGQALAQATLSKLSEHQIQAVSNPLLTLIEKASLLEEGDVLSAGLFEMARTGECKDKHVFHWLTVALISSAHEKASLGQFQLVLTLRKSLIALWPLEFELTHSERYFEQFQKYLAMALLKEAETKRPPDAKISFLNSAISPGSLFGEIINTSKRNPNQVEEHSCLGKLLDMTQSKTEKISMTKPTLMRR